MCVEYCLCIASYIESPQKADDAQACRKLQTSAELLVQLYQQHVGRGTYFTNLFDAANAMLDQQRTTLHVDALRHASSVDIQSPARSVDPDT
jgi:hypothetical protein